MMGATAASDAELIIKRSLEKEIGLLDMKMRLAEEEIREFERQYEMDSQKFMSRFESGELGDSQDFFEWWGLLRVKDSIADEIKKQKRSQYKIIEDEKPSFASVPSFQACGHPERPSRNAARSLSR